MFSGFIFSSHIFGFIVLLILTAFFFITFSRKYLTLNNKNEVIFERITLIIIFICSLFFIIYGAFEIDLKKYSDIERYNNYEQLPEVQELIIHYLMDGEISHDEYQEISGLYDKTVHEYNLNIVKNKIVRY